MPVWAPWLPEKAAGLIAEAESIAAKTISEEKEILEIVNGKIDG